MMQNWRGCSSQLAGLLLVAAGFISCAPQNPPGRGWQAESANAFWRAEVEPVPIESGKTSPAVVLAFSGYASTRPDDQASLRLPVFIPDSGRAELSFELEDGGLTENPSGLFFEVLINDISIFKRESSGGPGLSQPVQLDLRQAVQGGGDAVLEFRLAQGQVGDRSVVQDNYEFFVGLPVLGSFIDPKIETDRGIQKLLPDLSPVPLSPLPPDIPLPVVPANGLDWTTDARIVQPWGKTQWEAIVRAAERAPWLAKEFGFNTIIILPPEAHNAISPPAEHIKEKEFERGLGIYRANGFRIIMYTSIMHCGHAPVWQEGTLEKIHPEWSQLGPKGEPIRIYGANWLCPSTGALQYTLEYTADLVRRYGPDLVMLDNSEFFATPSGVSCYCPGCQVEFRRYVRQRFGESGAGRTTDAITIPTESGFLFDLWISWRNRVWGEAQEIFRRELRRVKPDLVVMSNTQYLRQAPDLATDLIYDHEDALISESVNMTMDGMINKLFLGRALAKGKPLWNYLGTFRLEDYDVLVPPDSIAMNVSTAYACGVRPWIVYRGFYEKPADNEASLDRMASVMAWHTNQEKTRSGLEPYAPVLSLVSLNSRNYRFSRLVPGHLTPLRHHGICSWIIEERAVEKGVPESCRVLIIADSPCLSDIAVRAIISFIRSGGTVIASPLTAWYDELGRLRPKSALWEGLGLRNPPSNPVKIDQGEVVCLHVPNSGDELKKRLEFARFSVSSGTVCSLIPYTDGEGNFVVYICSEQPLPDDLKIMAPGNKSGQAIVCVSTKPTPFIVSF
jgi:hypothetical protein